MLILIPFIITVVKAAQTTRADDDERPALSGIVPSINTFIPFNLISGYLSRIPWIPHLKYSYQSALS